MPRTQRSLCLAGILTALAITGMLSGCGSSPPTPTSAPDPPLSGEQRDKVIRRLNETLAAHGLAQLRSTEPRTICSNYERTNWDIDRVIEPLLDAANDDVDAWRDYHNHSTLIAIIQEQSGLSFQDSVTQTEALLRAFCESLRLRRPL